MTVTIQKPSLGCVVIYTNNDGVQHSARISRLYAEPASSPCLVGLHVDQYDFMAPTKIVGQIRHSLEPKPHTWRWPPPVAEKIEVAE